MTAPYGADVLTYAPPITGEHRTLHMKSTFHLLCVLAHPDDETLATGGILARYAAEGVETSLLTASYGERAWYGEARDYPGPQAFAHVRKGELRAAARALGLRRVRFLNQLDG